MHLICPNCGSDRIDYSGTTMPGGKYGSTDQRFTCKECDYTGSLVIDTDPDEEVDRYSKFPTSWIVIFAIASISAIALGAGVEESILLFITMSSILIILFYLVRPDEFQKVEEDLKNLDQDGFPLK